MPRYLLTCRQNESVQVELFADGTNEFAIGRGYENNVILVNSKLISRRHCQLFKEPDKRVRIMADTDVNGVVINDRVLILSGESIILRNGDEFYVVHSRKHPERNMSFALGIEYSPEDEHVEDTEEIVTVGVVIPVSSSSNVNLSIGSALSNAEPITGKNSTSDDEKQESPRSSVTPTNQKPSSADASNLSNSLKTALKPEVQLSSSLQCSICLSILYDPVTLSPCMHNFCAGCCSGWLATNRRCPECRHKISLLSKNPSLRAILDGYIATHPEAAKSDEEKAILDVANRLHFDTRPFISGSYLPLNDHGGDLVRHGGGETDEMSESTNATNENANESEGDDDSSVSDEESATSDSDDDSSSDEGDNATGWPLGSDTEIEENDIPERHEFEHDAHSTDAICRQCLPPETATSNKISGIKDKIVMAAQSLVGAASSAQSGDSSFHCTDPLQHVLCTCCDSPMPDRRTDRSVVQTCLICSLEYCNLYWDTGCQNGQCTKGCLKLLKDIDLQSLLVEDLTTAPASSSVAILLFGNVYETNQLRSYLQRKGISATQLRDILLDGLESGKFPVKARTLVGRRPDRETPVCSFCRVNIVQDLLFAYRRETLSADRRPNCPHGRYCVSQSMDSTHASVVNHICDPTPPGIVIDCISFQIGTVEQSSDNSQSNKSARERGSYDHMDLD